VFTGVPWYRRNQFGQTRPFFAAQAIAMSFNVVVTLDVYHLLDGPRAGESSRILRKQPAWSSRTGKPCWEFRKWLASRYHAHAGCVKLTRKTSHRHRLVGCRMDHRHCIRGGARRQPAKRQPRAAAQRLIRLHRGQWSGKSSLAFDTLYARRQALPSVAVGPTPRQFSASQSCKSRMSISSQALSPSISIQQSRPGRPALRRHDHRR